MADEPRVLRFLRPLTTRFTALSAGEEDALRRALDPTLDIRLEKGARTRRYVIRPGKAPGEWYCQVWFGSSQHRGDRVGETYEAHRVLAQYRREIGELLEDGWTELGAPPAG